ncbi:hypothetical protein D3C77_416850 [compost metagenome]
MTLPFFVLYFTWMPSFFRRSNKDELSIRMAFGEQIVKTSFSSILLAKASKKFVLLGDSIRLICSKTHAAILSIVSLLDDSITRPVPDIDLVLAPCRSLK